MAMNEVCTKYTAWKGENAGNPSLALARNEIPGECGSLPVEYRIVNGRCGGSFKHSLSRIIGPMTERPLNLRDRIRRISLGFVVLLLGIAILVFAVDLGLFRLRMLAHRDPYGSVVVSHYYAVSQKSGKTQFIFDPPAPETCVNALFPHANMQPCWYLKRHPEQRTDI
jgi:hypothetical protein